MRRWVAGLLGAVALAAGPAAGQAEAPLSAADRSAIAVAAGLSAADLARLDDETLITRLLAYARTEAGQRVRPQELDPNWAIAPLRRDLAAELRAARQAGRLPAWIATLSPATPEYRALKALRVRYAAMVAQGGWLGVPDGSKMRPGQRADGVANLRARLAAEGYGQTFADDPTMFDADLQSSLRSFQDNHALAPDGVLGAATRQALNVPAAERLAQIDANLERRRWTPAALPADRVEVDTGGQTAVLYRGGVPALAMRAIVGKPKHETPMFASRLEAVVFNPPWNVPTSIATKELLPAERRHPGYLAREQISWVDGHLQQAPGPKNSLGLVKFDLNNPFGVYLHDTPSRSLFARPLRALSHGCMRLEKPRELALALLSAQGGTQADVDQAIAAGVTQRVALKRPVAVYVQHWTVRVQPDGHAEFRPDIYGWDRKLAAAISSGN